MVGTGSPSSNLQVQGNAMVQSLAVGDSSSFSSNLQVSGSYAFSVTTLSSDTTLSDTTMVLADTSSGSFTLTLPSATANSGRIYIIKRTSVDNDLFLEGGGNLIDGSSFLSMGNSGSSGGSIKIISDGTQWYILSSLADVISDDTGPLAAWYSFEGSSSTTVTDVQGSNDGTFTNMDNSNRVTGISGNALKFNGTDEYVTVPDDPSIGDDLTEAFSITAWVKISSNYANGARMLEKTNQYFILSGQANGDLDTLVKNSNNHTDGDVALCYNRWVFMAWTYDKSNLRVYFNGELRGTEAETNTLPDPNGALYFGSDDGQNAYFAGVIDELRIYNTTIEAETIALLFEKDKPENYDRIAQLPFNESSGTTASDNYTLGFNGTLAGTTFDVITTAGPVGDGIELNGSNQYVDLPGDFTAAIVPYDNAPFTLSLWFNADTIDTSNISGGGGDRFLDIRGSGTMLIAGVAGTNELQFFVGSTGYVVTTISTATWYHVAFAFDGT